MNEMLLSVVIPAHNEQENLPATIEELQEAFGRERIPYELILVNDCSTDSTAQVIADMMSRNENIRTIDRNPPGGFGRAIRSGLSLVSGDVVIIYMADKSDDPVDAVRYYRKIEEGFDCVFGSRFRKGSKVENYPGVKLVANRIVNRCIQGMFFCRFNDLTNAFKAYRTDVVRDCGPFRASHFNITIEMSLSALIRKYSIAEIPISWYGRTWGSSHLRLREMGRRYLATLLKVYADKLLIADDLIAERLAERSHGRNESAELAARVRELEGRLGQLEDTRKTPSATSESKGSSGGSR
jgi:dolichol-phosphate mannosyltransferase